MSSSKIQVSRTTFDGLWWLLGTLEDYQLDPTTAAVCGTLRKEVNAKLNAMERRELFTAYKTAEQGIDEREQRRKAYLESAGIHTDWQSENEIKYSDQ